MERNQRKKDFSASSTSSSGQPFSIVWTILTVGVVLSFVDVIYIMKHIDSNSSSPATIQQQPQHNQAISSFVENQQAKLDKNSIDGSKNEKKMNLSERLAAKGPIIDLITEAGITFDPFEDADLLDELPDWEEVVKMYGPEPVIYGINEGHCQRFQEHSELGEHLVGVAGTFNSGTNLMAELLIHNCVMPERQKKYGMTNRGIRWQVPWGKHTPPGDKEYRETHKSAKDKNVDANEILPAVTIRDPLIWLKSMCKHPYTARWPNKDTDHCPDFTASSLTASVKYAEFYKKHDSILHHWNDYYQEYLDIEIPVLIVRFEDLVFHAKETTRQVCECAGGKLMTRNKFQYIVDSAKKGVGAHGKGKSFVNTLNFEDLSCQLILRICSPLMISCDFYYFITIKSELGMLMLL
jgi:hypothetical protein